MLRADFIKIAHRGASGSCPENTRVAFERAVEARVDMISAECQLSRDGHVVVFRDQRLDRITGGGRGVGGKSLRELKKIDVGAWFRKSFRGETILTLEELLEVVAGSVDLGLQIVPPRRAAVGMELRILFILSHYDYLDRTILSSFDYRSLRQVRAFAPEVRIGLHFGPQAGEDPFQVAREIRAYSLHIEKRLATPSLLEKAGKAGLKTFVGTVNEVSEMERLLSLGASGIASSYPEKFWKVRPRRGSGVTAR